MKVLRLPERCLHPETGRPYLRGLKAGMILFFYFSGISF